MTSEEIIQRLLDEKKISAAESLILLKDITKVTIQDLLPKSTEPDPYTGPNVDVDVDVVMMYGCRVNIINDDKEFLTH